MIHLADKDMTEKTLESYNDVFADIVNGLLFRGRQVIKEDSLIDAQPFSMYKMDGKIHEQERDVAKYWMETESAGVSVRIAFLGMENQTAYEKRIPLRVIGYDGAAYRAQLSERKCYPVISLILYFGDKPWGKSRSLYDAVEVPEEFRPFVNDYKINVFEIAHLPEEAISYFHSDFKIVVDYFVHRRKDPDYRPKNPDKFQHVDELLKMMAAITHDDRFVEAMEGGKPRDMCELLDRVEEKGRQEGVDTTRVESIRNIMESFKVTAQQAMEALKIPTAEQKKYLGML